MRLSGQGSPMSFRNGELPFFVYSIANFVSGHMVIPPQPCSSWSSGLWPIAIFFFWILRRSLRSVCWPWVPSITWALSWKIRSIEWSRLCWLPGWRRAGRGRPDALTGAGRKGAPAPPPGPASRRPAPCSVGYLHPPNTACPGGIPHYGLSIPTEAVS